MPEFLSISLKEIPDWLKKSYLYQNFEIDNENEDVFIPIPKNKFENDIKINNENDLYKYLEIIKYWMIINCPFEIYDYIKLNPNIINFSFIKENFYDLPFLDEFEIIFSIHKNDKYFFCNEASKKGYLNLLKYAHKNGYHWYEDTCSLAAVKGHLECLKYLHENGCLWYERSICDITAANKQLECLKYLHENGCHWDKNTCRFASLSGNLECLKYLHENGCPWDNSISYCTAKNGYLDCLKYAHENGCSWHEETCSIATENGHLECLKYALENGCSWNKYTLSNSKHLNVFDYAS